MANLRLLDDNTYEFPIVTRNAAGVVVPAPAGDVDSVTSSAPNSLAMSIGSLAAALGPYPAGTPTLNLVPLVQLSDATNGGGSISANLTDSAGLPIDHGMPLFDIGPDTAPATVGIDQTQSIMASQPVPTNPGP